MSFVDPDPHMIVHTVNIGEKKIEAKGAKFKFRDSTN